MTYHLKGIDYAPRVSDPRLGKGVLLDIGIYSLTFVYRLFGYSDQIDCQWELSGRNDTGEEILLTWKDGKQCRSVSPSLIIVAWRSSP